MVKVIFERLCPCLKLLHFLLPWEYIFTHTTLALSNMLCQQEVQCVVRYGIHAATYKIHRPFLDFLPYGSTSPEI
jgi:hypothetical protein